MSLLDWLFESREKRRLRRELELRQKEERKAHQAKVQRDALVSKTKTILSDVGRTKPDWNDWNFMGLRRQMQSLGEEFGPYISAHKEDYPMAFLSCFLGSLYSQWENTHRKFRTADPKFEARAVFIALYLIRDHPDVADQAAELMGRHVPGLKLYGTSSDRIIDVYDTFWSRFTYADGNGESIPRSALDSYGVASVRSYLEHHTHLD
jgi:hypothetical protein